MAIAAVAGQAGGNNANSATSVTRAFGSNVSVGSLIVILGMKYSPSSDAFAEGDCTKSAGTATLGTISLAQQTQIDVGDSAGYAVVGIWSAIVTGAGSLTMQVGGAVASSYLLIATHEFTGSWDSSRAEAGNVNSTASNNTSPATSGNATSAGAALFVGALNVNSLAGVTITPEAAFTQIYEDEAGTDDNGSAIYRIVSSGTTDQAEWTIASGTWYGWAAAVQVYKEGSVTTLTVSVAEAIAVTDTPTIFYPVLYLSVAEAITVGENVNVTIVGTSALQINVSEAVTVAEAVTVRADLNIAAAENIFVIESDFFGLITPEINLAEAVTIAEAVTVLLPVLLLSQAETITVTDTPTVLLPELLVNLADSLTAVDTQAVLLPELFINQAEAIAVSETTTVLIETEGVVNVNVSEVVTVTDSPMVLLPELFVNQAEGVAAVDTPTVLLPELFISQAESVTLNETAVAVITDATTLNINTGETVTLADTAAVLVPELVISVSDNITVIDSPAALLPLLVLAIAEAIMVGEDVTVSAGVVTGIPISLFTRSTQLTLCERSTMLNLFDYR